MNDTSAVVKNAVSSPVDAPPAPLLVQDVPELVESFQPVSLKGVQLPYLLDKPSTSDASTPLPLIMFLHGASGRDNINAVRYSHPLRVSLSY